MSELTDQQKQADGWTSTDNRVIKFTHHWTISNLQHYINKTTEYYVPNPTNDYPRIVSPAFSPPQEPNIKFYLYLCPSGYTKAQKDYVSVFLFLSSYNKSTSIRVQCKCSIMDVRNRKQNTQSFCYKLEPKGSANGFYEFISHWDLCSNAKEWLPNDKLTLLFEIEALVASVHTTGRGLMSQMNTQVDSKVLDNYGDLFECRKLSDVVLVAVGHSTKTEHRAHRAILAARSSVFEAMFDPNAKEHSESHVIIRHISGNVIEEMLRFVYTGKVQKLDELADGLLIAADKYELGLLKDICEKYIVNNLNIENALSMLVFADKHSVLLLRSKAIEYIKVNLSTLIETDNWQTVKDKPELYFELLSQAVTENQSKIDEFSRSSQLMKSQNSSYFYWIIFLSIIIVFMGINAFKN